MKIGVAQNRPVAGDIEQNLEGHRRLIDLAVTNAADMVIFPELSLTGYEPSLAQELATHPEDPRLDAFQEMSDTHQIIIGVGVPTKQEAGTCISLILLKPYQEKQIYSKQYLHADEEPYFVAGQNATGFIGEDNRIALAICYELSVPEHAQHAFTSGAEMYLASVVKSVRGIDKAWQRLSDIAEHFGMTVLMANSVGLADGEECAGKSAIWDNQGNLLGQLNDTQEGILLLDTVTQEVTSITL
ncbi:carbon-nitrogen hydrolase family protein [Rufibacter latericius]|uniref:Carbon-nitrogen hydrolase family protein n=1 Tax=Rufibacter latericius TaxID=2487040 RepID=A0A3M9N1Z1_9BACT|nr:carbon-nitrogen hydrolase family protein [Rufibacter latericius]RNI31347.1 carbon-nitrogen hydrolase family protein [Rufibacter latericius]